eukprot:356146-Chlamydomonas_euryale.AAC.1
MSRDWGCPRHGLLAAVTIVDARSPKSIPIYACLYGICICVNMYTQYECMCIFGCVCMCTCIRAQDAGVACATVHVCTYQHWECATRSDMLTAQEAVCSPPATGSSYTRAPRRRPR